MTTEMPCPPTDMEPQPMTTPKAQQHLTLTDSQLDAVTALATLAGRPRAERLLAVLQYLYGVAGWQAAESVDPTAYALPQDQWQRICSLLSGDSVGAAMDWVNYGPSAFTEAES